MGGDSWWYKVQIIEISIATTMTTTMKMIKYIRTERITPEGMTGEGTGDGIETTAIPAPSPRGRAQRIGEMGIIGRDGQVFRPWGEGGIHPCRSGGGRPPTMVRRPHKGAWRTGTQTPYATTPRGGPLGKFGSPAMMGAN